MIVKNEAHIIGSTLENLCHYIKFDYWVIVDTGSTDATKQIICDFFRDKNINGELHETEWKNFGFNRTDALTKAYNKTDYLLIFDADDRIIGDFILPTELTLDGYHLKFGDNFSYIRLLLVSNKLHWKFMGVLHEYIICTNENYGCKFENIEGNYHLISGKSGARSNNPNKYRDDAVTLEEAYHEAQKNKDEIMVRYSFYCAQSYKDAGMSEKSIEWYKKRISHGGWNQEVYYSYLTIGQLYAQMNNMESAFYYWALSFDADPERCEGIYLIIKHCREKGKFQLALQYYDWIEKNKTRNLLSKLFVTEDIYKYLLDYEFTIIACYVNKHSDAISSFHTLFKNATAMNIAFKENIIYNFQFYLKFIECTSHTLPFFYDYLAFVKQIYLETGNLKNHVVDITDKMKNNFTPVLTEYNSQKILSLTNSCKKIDDAVNNSTNHHEIILTMTSCKRFDLFQKTVNSFINNCDDISKITYFFCVDDNSSHEDRENMTNMYPFFNFYFKNSDEKGHRQSMNMIWNKLNELKPKFYLHLEDDWLFINKCNYITDSISFLERFESNKIHQILFNKNYAEVIHHYNTVGGKVINNTDNRFKLHIKDEPNLTGSNCAYWPHFSFRPSVIRTSAVLSLGNFDSPNTFFERDYADKYFNSGYTSAYFNEVNSIHIGKLTFESQHDKKNAYELNSEEQFLNSINNANANTNGNAKCCDMNKIKVINLLRRTDRRENVVQRFTNAKITNYEFVEAVDGKALTVNSELITLFKGNDFGNRRGVIGCALTHYNLWKKLLESDFDYYVIMEDDFTVVESFKCDIEKIKFEMYDVLLMGYHMFSDTLQKVKHIYRPTCCEGNNLIIDKLVLDYYIGGTHCYSINKCGARKLVDYIHKNGIKHGIDYLFKIVSGLECFETRPHISFAEWNEGGKAVDSDIQNICDSINLSPTLDDLLEKYVYYSYLDSFGNDMFRAGDKSLFDQLLIAENTPECVCFNTLGFFKNKLSCLSISPYFSSKDGLYIKKEYKNNKNISYSLTSQNKNIIDSINNSNGTYCFIHSCSLRNSNDILDALVGAVQKIQLDHIFIINIGNKISKVYPGNVDIVEYSHDTSLFEIPTLNMMHSFSKRNPESKILYLHTKGVSYQTIPQKVVDWTNMMLYFLINDDCIKLLDRHDIVGCNYKEDPHPHFSGNFWWTRARYVTTLKPIETTLKYDAEWWIFTKNASNPSYYSLHNSNINHYHELYPIEKYKENKIRVKMLCNWCSSKDLCNEWSNMCDRGYSWKNIQMTWTHDNNEIDYWVIINKPCDNSYYDPKRTIVFQMEPWVKNESHLWGVKTWDTWAEPSESTFLAVRGRKSKCHNNAFWQLELTYHELLSLKYENKNKIDAVSSICSSKYYDEGHIARIDFLKFLEMKGDVSLDIFNQDNQHGFKTYKGSLTPYVDKSKGLIPYKYYFMVENNYEENFITEKIWEPILCETLVFYYGCPNVSDYVDPEAFVQLDMNDFEKSYQIIKKAINEDWWNTRIHAIRREKQKILNELAFFPVIENIFKKKVENGAAHKTLAELIDNNRSDKNTVHSYLDLYEKKLYNKKYVAKNVVEIGIGLYKNSNGGSIKLWHDYFINATIYALDILHVDDVWDDIKMNERIQILTSTDAYNEDFFNTYFLNKNLKFDVLLDDGPHTLESMKQFIKLYTNVMTEDGILIIEDVQHIDWIQELIRVVPEHLQSYIEVHDLRDVKQRYDDIVFIINKQK